MSEGY